MELLHGVRQDRFSRADGRRCDSGVEAVERPLRERSAECDCVCVRDRFQNAVPQEVHIILRDDRRRLDQFGHSGGFPAQDRGAAACFVLDLPVDEFETFPLKPFFKIASVRAAGKLEHDGVGGPPGADGTGAVHALAGCPAVAHPGTVDFAGAEFIEDERLLPGRIRAADEDARELVPVRGDGVRSHGRGSSPDGNSPDDCSFSLRICSSSRTLCSRRVRDSGARSPMSVL